MARRNKRRRSRGKAGKGWMDRAWALASDARTPALLLLAAASILVITPWTRLPQPLVYSWWESSVYLPDAASIAAGLSAVAAVLLVGVLYNRYRVATLVEAEARATADAEFEAGSDEPSVTESRLPGLAWIAGLFLAVGVSLVLGGWFVAQGQVSPARVPIAVGETIEAYAVPYGADELEVMLPARVRLADLQVDQTRASVEVFGVGQDGGEPYPLDPGASLELDGFRVAFVGMAAGGTRLRAFIESEEPNTISAVAAEGKTFQLSLDGPRFEVLELTENYLGVMGPAARVRTPDLGEFWIFERASDANVAPDLGHSMRLTSVQAQPAGLFVISRGQPFWPIALGGTLFVLGLALLLIFPERIVRYSDETVCLWSFNDAGRVTEQTLETLNEEGRAQS